MKTKAIIPEYPLLVLPSLAKEIGLNEAIALQQLHYWILGIRESHDNIYKKRHFHKDKFWIYNTYEDWQEQFPFWSISTIKRTFISLEEKNIIESDNFNNLKIDRTKWYTINYENIPEIILANKPSDHQPLDVHPSGQNDPSSVSNRPIEQTNLNRPLPENTTENTTKKLINSNSEKKDYQTNPNDESSLNKSQEEVQLEDKPTDSKSTPGDLSLPQEEQVNDGKETHIPPAAAAEGGNPPESPGDSYFMDIESYLYKQGLSLPASGKSFDGMKKIFEMDIPLKTVYEGIDAVLSRTDNRKKIRSFNFFLSEIEKLHSASTTRAESTQAIHDEVEKTKEMIRKMREGRGIK